MEHPKECDSEEEEEEEEEREEAELALVTPRRTQRKVQRCSTKRLGDEHLVAHRKPRSLDAETKELLLAALRKNRFCRVLNGSSLETIVLKMEYFEFAAGADVMRQHEPGNHFFIIHSGCFEVIVNGTSVEDMDRGGSFGGIALLYNTNRTATVRAKELSGAWGVNGATFRHELKEHAKKHYQENRQLIDQICMFDGLSAMRKERVGKLALFTEIYEAGKLVLREGTFAAAVYVVKSGRLGFSAADGAVTELRIGDCFGWRSVLYGEPEGSSVVVAEKCELVGIGVKQLMKALGDDLPACLMQSFLSSVLKKDSVFGLLPPGHLQKILEKIEMRRYDPGQAPERGLLLAIVVDGEALGAGGGVPATFQRGRLCESAELMDAAGRLKDPAPNGSNIDALRAGPGGCRLATCSPAGLASALKELGLLRSGGGEQAMEYIRKVLLIKKVPVFGELSDEQIDGLVASLSLRRFPRGARVFQLGDVGEALFIIASGQVRVVIEGKVVRQLGKGACFGERALVFDERRSATIEVVGECVKLWTVDRQAFRNAVTEGMREKLKMSLNLQGTNVSLKALKHVRLIGKGSFGSVRLVEHKRTAFRYALKRIRKVNGQVPPEVASECALLAENCHPFLLQFVSTFETAKSIYILTELITGGQLYTQVVEKMGVMSRKHAQFYIGSLILTLGCLHVRNIVYRDLKPENVMLDQQGYVKLVDFGLAKRLHELTPRTFTLAGTAMYMAPEVIQGNGYGTECDIWSLGVMFFEFVCGQLPFGQCAEDAPSIFAEVLELPLEFPSRYNDAAGKKLLQGMLCKEADQRLGTGSNGWDDVKGHKYFKQGVSGNLFSMITGREVCAPFLPDSEEYSDEKELNELVTLSDAEELGQDEAMDFGCRLLAIFNHFDMNGDGHIDRRELGAVLIALDPVTFSEEVCDQLMKALDADNSGSISYDEFINWILNDQIAGQLKDALRSAIKLDAHD